MGYLTKYGSFWGMLPMTVGNVFWVAPSSSYIVEGRTYSASDNNDGLSPERALATVAYAVTKATANAGDVIALLPGTHACANAAVNKAGLTFIGLPFYPQLQTNDLTSGLYGPKVIITGVASNSLTVTADSTHFMNITFLPITQKTSVSFSAAATKLRFTKCLIDNTGVVGHANTKGIIASGAAAGFYMQGCVLKDSSVSTSCGPALDLGASTHFLIDKCIVYKDGSIASGVAWTTAIVHADGSSGTFRELDYIGTEVSVGTTKVVTGAALTGAGVVHMLRCTTTVNTGGALFSGYAAADADLCLNYVGTVAGGTGGTLITSTT